MGKRVCIKCGKLLPDAGVRTRVCQDCQKARQAERKRIEYKRRGDECEKEDRICERCGAIFHSRSPAARFCESCRHRGPHSKGHRKCLALADCCPLKGSYRREDGVMILPPTAPNKARKPPKAPPAGTKPGSMADVDYRLNQLNYERHEKGLPEISYGQFVSQQYLKEHEKGGEH